MNRIIFLVLLFLFPLLCDAQQQTAKPKPGDGIEVFLKRHGRSGKKYYKQFLELNARKLKGKKELILGVSYVLPPLSDGKEGRHEEEKCTGGVVKQPLFGKKNEKVKVTGSRLKGACFYVVSGHGGPDPGAIGKVNGKELHEDEYAYDVALRLAKMLMQEGAEVRIIIQDPKDGIRDGSYLQNSKRETCCGDRIPLNQVARLQQRCDKINAYYAADRKKYDYCRSIFLHVDSRSKRKQTDVFFYYAPSSSKGKRLASTMKKTFEKKYDRHQPGRGFEGTVSERGLYVLRNSTPVAVYVELGNLQNSFDQRRFMISSNRQALAKWMTEAFIADYNK